MELLRRTRKHHFLQTPRFFRRFRHTTAAVFSQGNRAILYRDGAVFFPALLDALRQATRHIHLEFYIIRNDTIGMAFAAALSEAAARGVEVLLLYDYIGCFDTPGSYFRDLEGTGVRCISFNSSGTTSP